MNPVQLNRNLIHGHVLKLNCCKLNKEWAKTVIAC